MTKKKPKAQHPVVSGKQTTFAVLAKTLRVSTSAAQQKYHRIKKVHGKVTMLQMKSPFRDPTVEARIQRNLIQRERDDLVRLITMHGPTHAAMVTKLDLRFVKQVGREAGVYAPKG